LFCVLLLVNSLSLMKMRMQIYIFFRELQHCFKKIKGLKSSEYIIFYFQGIPALPFFKKH
jgi:hypothetical protein